MQSRLGAAKPSALSLASLHSTPLCPQLASIPICLKPTLVPSKSSQKQLER